jgi:uncharacterized protein (TIGR03435 family)
MPQNLQRKRAGARAIVAVLAVLSLLQPATAWLGAQSANAQSFEVASVKIQRQEPQAGGPAGMIAQLPFMRLDGNRFRAANMTAARLLLEAYGPAYRQRDQIEGGPGWIDQDRFQIEALAPGVESSPNGSAVPESVRGMLRNLLATRFNLRVRPESRERPVYILVRARSDKRLGEGIRSTNDDCTTSVDARPGEPGFRKDCLGQVRIDGIKLVARPLDELVRFLASRLGKPVIDETGLSGRFDIDLFYDVRKTLGNVSPAGIAEFSSGMFVAVQERLGLKLETKVRPTPVLLIERIERPSAN